VTATLEPASFKLAEWARALSMVARDNFLLIMLNEMTYTVSGGTLNPTHSLTHLLC